jgi:hypothetical protein
MNPYDISSSIKTFVSKDALLTEQLAKTTKELMIFFEMLNVRLKQEDQQLCSSYTLTVQSGVSMFSSFTLQ